MYEKFFVWFDPLVVSFFGGAVSVRFYDLIQNGVEVNLSTVSIFVSIIFMMFFAIERNRWLAKNAVIGVK